MNTGLLVMLALLLIYLAVTGKYNCVTAATKCVFGGAKLCECGPQASAQGKPVAGQLPDAVRAGRDIYDQAREAINILRGGK